MKKFLLSVLALSGLLVACSPDKKDDRWEPNTQTAIAESERRVVLVEEYTGQKCPNCPKAAKILHQIGQKYPNHLIVVAMHSKHSGSLVSNELASDEAMRLAQYFNLPTPLPMAMFNRSEINNALFDRNPNTWEGYIDRLVNTHKVLDIKQSNVSFDEAKDEVTWSVTLTPVSNDVDYKLTAWLVEDVIAPQDVAGKKQKDYQHHNVHRAVLTEEGGKQIKLTDKEQKIELSATGIKSKVKDVKNTKIVVFAQVPGSEEILSANIIAINVL